MITNYENRGCETKLIVTIRVFFRANGLTVIELVIVDLSYSTLDMQLLHLLKKST